LLTERRSGGSYRILETMRAYLGVILLKGMVQPVQAMPGFSPETAVCRDEASLANRNAEFRDVFEGLKKEHNEQRVYLDVDQSGRCIATMFSTPEFTHYGSRDTASITKAKELEAE
jgi:hypothetical protein